MPQANRHSKNCDLCCKPFGSAKRHTVIKSRLRLRKSFDEIKDRNKVKFYSKALSSRLVVCGECKSYLHNLKANKIVQFHGHEFSHFFTGIRKKKKGLAEGGLISGRGFNSFKRGSVGGYSFKRRKKWMEQHQRVHKAIQTSDLSKLTEMERRPFYEAQKQKERAEWNELKAEIIKEEAAPLLNWLES